jgi:hypothetical protein
MPTLNKPSLRYHKKQTMHIAYSALQNTIQQPAPGNSLLPDDQFSIRFKAYLAVCNKYSTEIAAIQKYLPGWMPAFSNSR